MIRKTEQPAAAKDARAFGMTPEDAAKLAAAVKKTGIFDKRGAGGSNGSGPFDTAVFNFDAFVDTIRVNLPYGGYSNAAFFVNDVDNTPFFVKLTFDKKTAPQLYAATASNDSRATTPQFEVEIRALDLLRREIVEPGVSPHVVALVDAVVCRGAIAAATAPGVCEPAIKAKNENFTNYVRAIMCKHGALAGAGLARDGFSVACMEHADISLKKFIAAYGRSVASAPVVRALLFQVVFTLAAVAQKFPGFRHNDMHGDNVMVVVNAAHEFDPLDVAVTEYRLGGRVFRVPYYGVTAKLIDFGFCAIPTAGIVSDIVEDLQIMHFTPQSDVTFLLCDIYNSAPSAELEALLYEIDPAGAFARGFDHKAAPADVLEPGRALGAAAWARFVGAGAQCRVVGRFGDRA